MIEASLTYTLLIEGDDRCLPCSQEKTILRSLIDGGVFLEANCGGRGTCGKCKIQVLKGQVIGKNGLQVQPGNDNTYLACQVYPQGDITIVLKKEQASQKGQATEIIVDDSLPLVKKVVLAPAYPTVDNHYSLQEMIRQALAAQTTAGSSLVSTGLIDNAAMLRRLSEVVETKPELITITLLDNQAIAVEANDTSSVLYGVAFDIGTTTVVGMLVDINARKVVAVCSKNNPQASMGADVISRIQATHELLGGLEGLSQLIRRCLNQIIAELCSSVGVASSHVYAVTIAGNATMSHLVLEISPSTLVRKPYAALFKYMSPLNPQDIELEINPQGEIMVLPNIASFVGSDTTAAIMAVDQDISENPMLLVDLGTNGEMVIGYGNMLYACSTAAGPAFEGAHIRDGMRAIDGAITDVAVTEQNVLVQVIGRGKPAGICGSGIVKAVAELLKAGILEASGRFTKSAAAKLPIPLQHRLKKQGGQWEFVLVEGKDSASGADISITQADVRQIQLVKSSICTGIQFLMERLHSESGLTVCLAGAFGNYIDIDSALTIGMLPGNQGVICSVGNAAGTGAVQALLSAAKMQRCIAIASKVNYIELAAQHDFQNRFLANLTFPLS
ncbi:Na(+)-translocating NADH-quinone reductase subunit F [Sporomusa silvacetica DSM 10669]|uniref:Na(+)-translocating NADH-quinone reductase subunit F n=1 Tax=Sporomusa silvacetica DSM 10669 TaxID=1123289 RepID=A0ABZ3IPZ8_9FIRM|nr:ASKHA domain-containing protein [Sporomusa silvacetica]OZC16286.1 Na(+)-translocating NADH-quinone reductase subunit F [Sporomusa silvacetica DSM 10669]